MHADVAVTSTAQPHGKGTITYTVSGAGVAVASHERRKIREWAVVDGASARLIPLAFESQGRWGHHAIQELGRLARIKGNAQADSPQEATAVTRASLKRWRREIGIALQRGNARIAIASLGQPVPETLDFDLLQAAGDFHEEAPWAHNLPRHARQADTKPHGYPSFQLGTFTHAPDKPDPPSEEEEVEFPPPCPLAAPFFNHGSAAGTARGGSDTSHPSRPLATPWPPPVAAATLAAQHSPPSSGSDLSTVSRPLVESTPNSTGVPPPCPQAVSVPAQHPASSGSDTFAVSRPLVVFSSCPRSGDGATSPHPLGTVPVLVELTVQQQALIPGGDGAPAHPQADLVPVSPFSPLSVSSVAAAHEVVRQGSA